MFHSHGTPVFFECRYCNPVSYNRIIEAARKEKQKVNHRTQKSERATERKEHANQAGMMGGCDAYNDAMGYLHSHIAE